MRISNIFKLSLLLILQFCIPMAMAADEPVPFVEKPVTRTLFNQLRSGGYVLYMRHGNTDKSRPDRAPQVDLNDCSTQRPLTTEGRELAARVGKYIREARIPVGEVLSSPLCRAKESAGATFGRFEIEMNLMYSGNMTEAEKIPVNKKTRELLSKPVPANTNRFIVVHAPNLMDVMGYFPKIEGTVVVFRPGGDKGFEYLGSIVPEQWQALLLK